MTIPTHNFVITRAVMQYATDAAEHALKKARAAGVQTPSLLVVAAILVGTYARAKKVPTAAALESVGEVLKYVEELAVKSQ